MDASDIDAIRERHVREKGEQDCVWCETQWPCDTAQVLAEYDEAKDEWTMWAETARRITEYSEQHMAQRNAARALADELAEALVRVRRVADDCWCGTNILLVHTDDCLNARAALAKWEASKA